jgi:hypothetical protein
LFELGGTENILALWREVVAMAIDPEEDEDY